ncbi:hypothetical protein BDF19DRAFT_462699 [Syncephalis fuscata]|nr:hypothetical protein BDF19DRAFT_462699 [Syncephalis fuscata]
MSRQGLELKLALLGCSPSYVLGLHIYIYIYDYQKLCLFFAICFSIQPKTVSAKITFTSGPRTETYPLNDHFLHPQPYYRYEGLAFKIHLTYNNVTDTCKFSPINESNPVVKFTSKMSAKHPEFALLALQNLPPYTNCEKNKLVTESLDHLMQQLVRNGFPPVKLLILERNYSPNFGFNDNFIMGQNEQQYYDILTKYNPVNIAILSSPQPLSFIDRFSIFPYFHYIAEQEPNPWYAILTSKWHIAYKIMYSVIIALALLYACARVIMLAKLKMLHLNLLLASFVVTIVYCIFFLMHLTMLYQPSKSTGLYGIYTILSGVPFDLILWYWSIVGRNLFSKRSIILLRSIIIIDIASNIARTILTAMDSDISSDGFRILFENQMDVYVIIFALSWLNTIVFGGFAIWFGINGYKLKKHPKGRYRFIRLGLFALLGFATYIVFAVYYTANITFGLWLQPTEILASLAVFDTAYMLRVLVFLSVFGIRWPRPNDTAEEETRAPLGGMTTIGCHTTMETRPLHRQLTHKLTQIIRKQTF